MLELEHFARPIWRTRTVILGTKLCVQIDVFAAGRLDSTGHVRRVNAE
jgi:ABC-type transporter Mla MlaB component